MLSKHLTPVAYSLLVVSERSNLTSASLAALQGRGSLQASHHTKHLFEPDGRERDLSWKEGRIPNNIFLFFYYSYYY